MIDTTKRNKTMPGLEGSRRQSEDGNKTAPKVKEKKKEENSVVSVKRCNHP